MLLDLAIWLALWAAFAAGGLMLVIRGWRGRVADAMPHCRTCEYNLTALTSNACPECGAAITPEQIVYSLRRRRPGRVVVGLVLLLITGLVTIGLGRAITRIDWHRYYPIEWLLTEAEAGNWLGPNELRQRLQRNALSDSDVRLIVKSVLANQKQQSFPGRYNEVVDLVGFLDAVGKLTNDERSQFYPQLVDCQLRCRPKIRLGDPIPYQLSVQSHGPASIFSNFKQQQESLDGSVVQDHANRDFGIGVSTYGTSGLGGSLATAGLPAGRHRIEVKVRQELFRRRSVDFDMFLDTTAPRALINHPAWKDKLAALAVALKTDVDRDTDVPFWTQIITRSQEFEIVPADSPDPISFIEDPAIGGQLKQVLTVGGVTLMTEWNREGKVIVYVDFLIGDPSKGPSLPANIAFGVILKTADREISAGELIYKRGTTNCFVSPSAWVESFEDEEVLVILRPSRDAALRTTDIDSIWNGEITFGPIKVKRSTERRHVWGTSSVEMQPATPMSPDEPVR